MRKTRKLLPANYRKNWAKKAQLSPCKSGRSSDYACAKCVHCGPSVAEVSTTLNAIVLGLGLGGCFSLFMLVALDHLPSPTQAGALNALMQGGGSGFATGHALQSPSLCADHGYPKGSHHYFSFRNNALQR